MSEQEENERICEWLGWKRIINDPTAYGCKWRDERGICVDPAWEPTFRTGNDMIILWNELMRRGVEVDIASENGECWVTWWMPKPRSTAKTKDLPDAVRAAVLAIIEGGK